MIDWILSIFYPNSCPYCGCRLTGDLPHCSNCLNDFPKLPFIKDIENGRKCIGVFEYDSSFTQAILDYKFKNKVSNAKSFCALIATAVRYTYPDKTIDTVTYVPLSARRKRERGFDQAELLAKETAAVLGTDFEKLVIKVKDNKIQHTLSRSERIKNVIGIYSATNKEYIKGKTILIIDDICTTGSTLSACADILEKYGAAEVILSAVAVR